jgi:1-deoxy-D-xylulose 5-phosphate reductoisomerase
LIAFVGIPQVVEQTMDKHEVVSDPELADILGADQWARNQAEHEILEAGSRNDLKSEFGPVVVR